MESFKKGYIVKAITLLPLFLILLTTSVSAQNIGLGFGRLVSPGDLAKEHKEWNSIRNCIDCHNLRGGINDKKCYDCHKVLGDRVAKKKGYHALREVKQKACEECHKDHKGESYKMVLWPGGNEENFDHSKASYQLKEKHKKAKCLKCHDKKTKRGFVTYLGLNDDCVTCHKDIHQKTLGQKCGDCHINARSFVGQDVRFDHNKQSKYRLDGKHDQVKCEKCHKGTSKDKAVYKVAEYKKCISCHKKEDVHKGSLGNNCEKCHNTADWKQVKNFAHEKTKYPLRGKHATVTCKACHPSAGKKNASFKVAKFDTCQASGCHDTAKRGATVHGDQFSGRDCAECHTETDWKRETFAHNAKKRKVWRLNGKHADVKCGACHKSTGVMAAYKRGVRIIQYKKIDSSRCDTKLCHSSATKAGKAHGKQFKGKDCAECHTAKDWKRSTFKHDSAKYSGYKLRGAHAKVKCSSCHPKNSSGVRRYRPIDSTRCDNKFCHDSGQRGAIHGSQFGEKDCKECHTEKEWKPITFKHGNSDYKLHGKHAKVKCAECHKVDRRKPKVRYKRKAFNHVIYAPINTKSCGSAYCHADPHKKKLEPRECAECHVVDEWKDLSTNFDHIEDTDYKLIGKHKNTKCVKCHTPGADKKPVWKPLSASCISCHKKDDKHKGALGNNCDECHTTANWDPLPAAHEVTGFPLIQTHGQLVCIDCHTKGNGDFTGLSPDCQQCHTDPHRNQMGRLCRDCHTHINWEPSKFNHTITGFRLEGAHRYTECADCHKFRSYRTTPSACISCHEADFARGAAFHGSGNTNCMDCHNTYGFFGASGGSASHTTMTFSGAHAAIKSNCTSCHTRVGSNQYGLKFPGATQEGDCYTCHKTDYNRNHSAGWPTECFTCHVTATWITTTGVAKHTTMTFSGAHSGIKNDCSECHVTIGSNPYGLKFPGASQEGDCFLCHQSDYRDEHDPGWPTACFQCHITADWDIGRRIGRGKMGR